MFSSPGLLTLKTREGNEKMCEQTFEGIKSKKLNRLNTEL